MSYLSSMSIQPPFRSLPRDRSFSEQFLELREAVFQWMADATTTTGST